MKYQKALVTTAAALALVASLAVAGCAATGGGVPR